MSMLNWGGGGEIINKNQSMEHACKYSHAREGGVVVPRTNAALPLWTATDNTWRRYLNKFSSHMVSLRQLPRSLKNLRLPMVQ